MSVARPSFAPRVLAFYRAHKRDLPWRRTRDPYAIWVSEIMLQQTRVATVIPYFERWMARLPTVERLARAEEDTVLSLWSGLGYYSRARNLQKGARHVLAHHGGAVPADVDALRAIPGVGPYTAGAIASIAFDLQTPLVDGNVMRVFARCFGIDDDITTSGAARRMWKLAEDLVPKDAPGDYNQALMELGAEVCTPKSPACNTCCVRKECVARREARVDELPVRKPRAKRDAKPVLSTQAICVRHGRRILLGRRKKGGLYGGLWELPQAPSRKGLVDVLGGSASVEGRQPAARHEQELTHRLLKIAVWRGKSSGELPDPGGDYEHFRFFSDRELAGLGLSSATRQVISAMEESDE